MPINRWMNKEDVVYLNNGCYSPITKWNLAIFGNMGVWRGYYAKWNMSDRERLISYELTYMWNLKNNKMKDSSVQKTNWGGLPWWCSGWESACQCRGHGFEPWSGKIPHAAERLGPWATIAEPARLEPVLRTKRGRNSERPAHHEIGRASCRERV